MPETLYIIDGFAQIFRAYYAIRNGMRSPVTSEPTQAVFGFTDMLFKLMKQFKPHYVVVAMDAPGKTFRDEMVTDYKATRAPTPDDLLSQIPRICDVIESFGIPIVRVPGLEADDLIATIVDRMPHDPACAGVHVRIVSKDKDLEQLLNECVSMFDIHTDTVIDVAALWANKGIRPDQVVDLLTLIGDTVDNVKGVDGIGPKTAAQLIQEFGSVDGIYEHIDEIKGKKQENLIAAKAWINTSRELVKLKRDGDFHFSMDEARVSPIDLQKMLGIFKELGFNRFQDEARRLAQEQGLMAPKPSGAQLVLGEEAPTPAAATVSEAQTTLDMGTDVETVIAAKADPAGYTCVRTVDELNQVIAAIRAAKIVAVDTETTGLGRDAHLCGVSFSVEAGKGWYVPVRSVEGTHFETDEALDLLRPLLEDESVAKCGHNLKFDVHVLLRYNVILRGIRFDSMLAGALLDSSQPTAKIDHMALGRLNHQMISYEDICGSGADQVTIDCAPLDKVTVYAAEDADIALRLEQLIEPELEASGMAKLMAEVEGPLSTVLARMEHTGILCDPAVLFEQGEGLRARVEELRDNIYKLSGETFNIDSTRQLAEVLFDKMGYKVVKKTATGRSTDSEVLDKLIMQEDASKPETAVPRLVVEYRQLQKLIGTYLGNLRDAIYPEDGRIHTTFHQLMTATGRLASNSPNLQNIPVRSDVGRQIRKAFVAPPGWKLICADYSQIELRLLAHLSGDEALTEAFSKNEDVHTAVASQVFGVEPSLVSREMRGHAKTVNFGIIYGVSAFGLARRIEGLDQKSAAKLIADYKARFTGIDRFLAQCVDHAKEHGYVTTLLGRRRAIPEINSSNGMHRALGERLAINTVVQGSAADLIKVAMVNLQKRIDDDALPMRLLLQIHDELVLETPEDRAEADGKVVCEVMEHALKLDVPLIAEAGIGSNWMDAK